MAEVPTSLRKWFVVHFVADIVFGIPLFLFPVKFLSFLGWGTVDPIATRIVASALFGIGIESYLGRKNGLESFLGMLNLKIIWSLSTLAGILISYFQGMVETFFVWVVFAVFLVFNFIWLYWKNKLMRKKYN